MDIAFSVNGVPIRLTYERWYHVVENHDEMASYFHDVLETVESPQFVVQGNNGTLKATRNLGKKKWIVVIYRELSKKELLFRCLNGKCGWLGWGPWIMAVAHFYIFMPFFC
ncbi:MAG: hypothetical protein ABIF71_11040 [Planctomycetota bacterium]